jgi:hypothetical protein
MPPALFAFLAWILGYVIAGIWLNRFRCPRCGKLYYWRLEWKGALEGRRIGGIAATADYSKMQCRASMRYDSGAIPAATSIHFPISLTAKALAHTLAEDNLAGSG